MLLWKAGAGLVFIAFSLAMFFIPQLGNGLNENTKAIFAGLLLLYGLYRLVTFYLDYRNIKDDSH